MVSPFQHSLHPGGQHTPAFYTGTAIINSCSTCVGNSFDFLAAHRHALARTAPHGSAASPQNQLTFVYEKNSPGGLVQAEPSVESPQAPELCGAKHAFAWNVYRLAGMRLLIEHVVPPLRVAHCFPGSFLTEMR